MSLRVLSSKTPVQARPVSKTDQKRLLQGFLELDPFFKTGVVNDNGISIDWLSAGAGTSTARKLITVVESHGWEVRTVLPGPFLSAKYVVTKDSKWPCVISVSLKGVCSFHMPSSETEGPDDTFERAFKAMTKRLLPSQAKVIGHSARWSLSGGYRGEKILKAIREKAKQLGFVAWSSDPYNSPDGSSTSTLDGYRHPDGWVLRMFCNYGSTASSNSYSATLSWERV